MRDGELTGLGHRDSEKDWKNESCGCDDGVERDEECYVGCMAEHPTGACWVSPLKKRITHELLYPIRRLSLNIG